MNKFTRDEQISAVIKSNLISFNLNPSDIRAIVEQTTADILHVLDNYREKPRRKEPENE